MDEFCTLLFYDIVWEHDRFHPVKSQCTLKNSCRMCSQSDMSDLARCLRFHQSFQCTALADHLIKLFHAWVVYLIKVDIVCAEISKTCLNIRCHCFFCSGHGFGRKHKFITDSLQTISDVLLTDGISSCRINIVDSHLHHLVKQFSGAFLVNLLDRNSSKSHTRDLKSCFSKYSVFHNTPSSFFIKKYHRISPVVSYHFLLIIHETDIHLFLYRFSVCRPGLQTEEPLPVRQSQQLPVW